MDCRCSTHLCSASAWAAYSHLQGQMGSLCGKQAASERLGNELGGLGFRIAESWPLTLWMQSSFVLPLVGYTCKYVRQNVQMCTCPSWHSPVDGKSQSKRCLCLPERVHEHRCPGDGSKRMDRPQYDAASPIFLAKRWEALEACCDWQEIAVSEDGFHKITKYSELERDPQVSSSPALKWMAHFGMNPWVILPPCSDQLS